MRTNHKGVAALTLVWLMVGCADMDAGDVALTKEEFETSVTAVRDTPGHALFNDATFGGNGRTCRTCHSRDTGSVSPEEARLRFARNSNDPLFRHDGLDDGVSGVTRMLEYATFRIELPLPPNVALADSPARSVVVLRASLSTHNVALEDTLMNDGRAASLQSQALSAINGHAQNTLAPTPEQLDAIAKFERSREFFTSARLWAHANGGAPPRLPAGRTESERRGRRFFENLPFAPNAAGTHMSLDGICAHCHSGPMLNTANEHGFFPVGSRITTAGVSERNRSGNPLRTFVFTLPDGTTTRVTSPDPGRALITGNPADANLFKTPSLWGINRTAPYFHDHSARNFDEMIDHYQVFFDAAPTPLPVAHFTHQDREDLKATTFKVGGVILPGKESWRGSRSRKGRAAPND